MTSCIHPELIAYLLHQEVCKTKPDSYLVSLILDLYQLFVLRAVLPDTESPGLLFSARRSRPKFRRISGSLPMVNGVANLSGLIQFIFKQLVFSQRGKFV